MVLVEGGGTCPGHWIWRSGTKWPISWWCATATSIWSPSLTLYSGIITLCKKLLKSDSVWPSYSRRRRGCCHRCKKVLLTFLFFNSFAADFLAPSAGKNIYVREIKLQSLTFVNRAITVTNGTEGVLSTLVANGSERVNKISFLTFFLKKICNVFVN